MNPPRSSFVLLLPPKLLALRIPLTIEVWRGVLQKFGRLRRTCELPNFVFADLKFSRVPVRLVHFLTQLVKRQLL